MSGSNADLRQDADAPPEIPAADERERERVEKRFLEIQKEYGSDTECRLRGLYAIWRNPLGAKSLKASEEKELREFRVIGGKIADGREVPAEISMGKFAEFVTEKYGKSIGAQWFTAQVKKWIERDGMPPVGKGNRLGSGPKWESWFVANILEKTGNGSGDESYITKGAKAEAERKITAARREARADAEEQRKCDARWMLTDAFQFFAEGWFTILRQERIADDKRNLDSFGASMKDEGLDDAAVQRVLARERAKQPQRLEEWRVNLVGDTKTPDSLGKLGELEKAARELSEQKKAELKVKV